MAHTSESSTTRQNTWRVILLIEGHGQFQRGMLLGIRRYAAEHANLVFRFSSPEAFSLGALADWPWDGVLLQAEAPARTLAQRLRHIRQPVVSLSDSRSVAPWPCVSLDNKRTGELAAEYFMGKQVRQCAFAGMELESLSFAAIRHESFTAALERKNVPCKLLRVDAGIHGEVSGETAIARWLRNCPKPVAVFAANDSVAFALASICAIHRLRIPDEVMILGVDNDEMLCELSHPPLSSIAVPAEEIGYRAATLLAECLAGKVTDPPSLILPPRCVVTRRSTEIYLTDDPLVRQAQRLMGEGLAQRVNIKQVAQELHISRRLLERRFQGELGQTPHEHLLELRVGRAQSLLQLTDKSLAQIARECGFRDASAFTLAFRRQTGKVPSACRKKASA